MKFKTDNLNKENASVSNFFNSVQDCRSNLVETLSNVTDKTTTHLSNCLIKIVPITLETPQKLFGGKIKSAVANKITVFQAVVSNKNPEDFTEGDILFETLMSDESLSMAIFNSNSKKYPCTFISALGDQLRPFSESDELENSNSRIQGQLASSANSLNIRMNEFKKLIYSLDGKPSLSKNIITEIIQRLDVLTSHSYSNFSYYIEQLAEEFEKDKSSIKVELSSTIDKLSKYYAHNDILSLSSPTDNGKFNILRWMLNGKYNSHERNILASLVDKIKDSSDLDSKTIKVLNEWLLEFTNTTRLENYDNAFESNGYFKVSKIWGDSELFGSHTSRGGFIDLQFGSAYIESTRGQNHVRSIDPICSLSLSYEDFLVLLRGNSSSDALPCTISRFVGVGVPFKRVGITKKEELIQDVRNEYLNKSSKLIELYSEISELLKSTSLKKKADKDTFKILIKKFTEEFHTNLATLQELSDKDTQKVTENFKDEIQKAVEDITLLLPSNQKNLLLELMK